jgi:uncharacterized protein YhaN
MKILRLDLIAFGPFSGVSLDLAGGSQGLHLIYGPNEAGKSSGLRALGQMFFGIPGQTSDDFVHPYKDLRIGAWIRDKPGAELQFIRRKANSKTLRGPDDSRVIEDAVLRRFLGGIDQDAFQTMFGINNVTLAEGGKAIVEGGGDIGALLFAAGAGISDLRTVQQTLDQEANSLFLARGTAKPLNVSFIKLDELRREVKKDALPSSEWLSHDQALADALAKKAIVANQLEERRQHHGRLKRICDALPAIAKRKRLWEEIAQYADAVLLPKDFGGQRLETLVKLQAAETAQAEALTALADLDRQIAELAVPDALLEHAEMIDQLHLRLGSHQKAMVDRSMLLTEHQRFEAAALTVLRDLGGERNLSEAESLRLTAAQRRKIQDLGTDRKALAKDFSDALANTNDLRARLENTDRQLTGLAAPRDPIELHKSIAHIQKQGNLEEQREAEGQGLFRAEKQAQIELQRLPLWSGTLEELQQLPIPAAETIDRFEDEFDGLENDRRGLQEKCDELESESLRLDGQIQQLEMQQAVPTEKDLEEARGQREAGWLVLRQALQQGEESGEGNTGRAPRTADLGAAYEASVRQADEIADRLRREADQVAAKARCVADRNRCEQELTKTRRQIDRVEAHLESTRHEWSTLWQPLDIEPMPPKEMRAWCRKYEALLGQARVIHSQRERVAGLDAQIEQGRRELNQRLLSLGEPAGGANETLAMLLDRSLEVVERLKSLESQRRRLAEELSALRAKEDEARQEADRAEQRLRQWQADWSKAMAQLRLDSAATTSQANAVLGCLSDLFDLLGKADSHRQRIDGIERDSRQFTTDVRNVGEHLGRGLDGCPVEQAAAELHAGLNRARAAQAKLDALTKQRFTVGEKLTQARGTVAECRDRLEVMRREAGCPTIEGLAEAEQRSLRRRELQAEIERCEDQLLRQCAGASLVDFIAEAEAVDPDALAGQIGQAQADIADLDNQKSELDQAIGSEREILKTMDGSAKAAAAAEQLQFLLASIGTDAEQYVRLRLASTILREAIERYREKNQGPVLKRASDLFADLTVGSFEGLRVEVNDQGKPMLVGVRPGKKEWVSVQEGMSDGTRDQLYLALRLASLETYLDKHEPIPFVVDDLLINFDDDRAAAALKALAQLSERTQVLFFTHHQHLVDLAANTLDDDVLFKHQLRGKSAPISAAVRRKGMSPTGTTL